MLFGQWSARQSLRVLRFSVNRTAVSWEGLLFEFPYLKSKKYEGQNTDFPRLSRNRHALKFTQALKEFYAVPKD
jgi:hypothetical protein